MNKKLTTEQTEYLIRANILLEAMLDAGSINIMGPDKTTWSVGNTIRFNRGILRNGYYFADVEADILNELKFIWNLDIPIH